MFSPDGRYDFVRSSFTPELTVIDTASHQIIKRVPQSSPFCPNIAVSPENDEVWITLKDIGKVQVFRANPPFEQIALLDTGPITNHVNFANNRNGKFAYITIGGANEVKAYRRGAKPELVATIPVGHLPHGIWPSGDGTRVYIALENGEHAVAIDTLKQRDRQHSNWTDDTSPRVCAGRGGNGRWHCQPYAARRGWSGAAYRDAAAIRSRHRRGRYGCGQLAQNDRLAADRAVAGS